MLEGRQDWDGGGDGVLHLHRRQKDGLPALAGEGVWPNTRPILESGNIQVQMKNQWLCQISKMHYNETVDYNNHSKFSTVLWKIRQCQLKCNIKSVTVKSKSVTEYP